MSNQLRRVTSIVALFAAGGMAFGLDQTIDGNLSVNGALRTGLVSGYGFTVLPAAGSNVEAVLSTASNAYADLVFSNMGTRNVVLRGSAYGIGLTGANPRLAIDSMSAPHSESLYVNGSSALVGAFTAGPSGYTFSVKSGAASVVEARLTAGSNAFADLYFGTAGADQVCLRGSGYGLNVKGPSPKLFVNGADSARSENFYVNGSSKFDNGTVIIGTDPSGTGLLRVGGGADIKGTMRAKAVLVTANNWADSVFDRNVGLSDLDAAKCFIAKNKHLPGVSSEAYILANGIDTAKMFACQMGKIEELTIYAIELKEAKDAAEERCDQLEADNALLRAKQDVAEARLKVIEDKMGLNSREVK